MSYEVLESKQTYTGKMVNVTVDTITLPNGKTTVRETVIRGEDAAAVLPIDADGKMIFVRQYRHAFREMLLEIPAGVLEAGEEPAIAAKRELAEETGKIANHLEYICELYPTVGYCTEKIYLYFAEDFTECPQCLDVDEFVEVEKYTPQEALDMIVKGEIKDAKTVAAIYAYHSRKQKV